MDKSSKLGCSSMVCTVPERTGMPVIEPHARTLELPLLVRSVMFFFIFTSGEG